MDNRDFDRIRQNRIEMITLAIFSIYVAGATIMFYGAPNYWIIMPMQAFLVISWMAYVAHLRSYSFRVNMYSVFLEACVVIYAFSVSDTQSVCILSIAVVIVIGLYEVPKLLLLPACATVIILLYQIFGSKVIHMVDMRSDMQLVLEIIAQPLTIFSVYFFVTEENRSKEHFQESIEELEAIQKSKDDFLANVSHELRTPINTICGMSEIVLRDGSSSEINESMRNIQTAGKNLLSVVTDILDFSELQSGKMELVEETFNITSTINDVTNMIWPKIEDKRIQFVVDCDISIPAGLKGDEQKLRRVIMSLLDNAVKFTDEGFIELGLKYRAEEYGANLCVTVKDTGIGMRPESLNKIFAGFTQVNGERNRSENGVGLGLSIAQAIVELMGGFITVNSVYGKGTEVQVVVPMTVTDDTHIAAVVNPENIRFAAYKSVMGVGSSVIGELMKERIISMAKQTGVTGYVCRNLSDLQRRVKSEPFTHVFTGFEEYIENREYFDELSLSTKIVLFISPGQENQISNDLLTYVYRPMYVIPLINIVNGYVGDRKAVDNVSQREKFTMPDAHILVVDDSYMNVRVLEGLLKPYAIKVTTASSGMEALEKIMDKSYDFVFMDHMMPEMDGIECMHRIRDIQDPYCKSVPIIALTANAVAGMREMFIREGCADFIAKPVEVSGLERILKKFIPEEKIIYGTVEEDESDAVQTSIGSIRIGDLDVKKGLLYCGNEENYLDILKMHARNGESNRDKIEEFYKSEDWDNYTILVHALKSSMKSIGADPLSNMAKRLEQAGKELDIEYIKGSHEAMIEEYDRVIHMLNASEMIKDSSEETVDISELEVMDDEAFDRLIGEFEDAAYTFEAKNMLEVLDKAQKYQYNGHSLIDDISTIRHKVEMSDYMSAVDAFGAVRNRYRNR